MLSSNSFADYVLPLDYLRKYGVYDTLDFDATGDRRVVTDPGTGSVKRFTGLEFFEPDPDDHINGISYEFCIDGTGQGPVVRFHTNGRIQVYSYYVFGPEGTRYEFYETGKLYRISLFCSGNWVARREFDEDGNMTFEELGMTYSDFSEHLDSAYRKVSFSHSSCPLGGLQRHLFPLDFLAQFGSSANALTWDHSGNVRLLGNTEGTFAPFSGFDYDYDEQTGLVTYSLYIQGRKQGPAAVFHKSGRVKSFGQSLFGLDGTHYEFFDSGAPHRISLFCSGQQLAVREYDESGEITRTEENLSTQHLSHYLDAAQQ